jgi:hypothetical protein
LKKSAGIRFSGSLHVRLFRFSYEDEEERFQFSTGQAFQRLP